MLAAGGTNGFGLWAGANTPQGLYQPMATTYDSGYPLGETGDYGQRGLGGPNKYQVRGTQWSNQHTHRLLTWCEVHIEFSSTVASSNCTQMIRQAIAQHTGMQLPEVPPHPTYVVPQPVTLKQQSVLLKALDALVPGGPVASPSALPAEEYGLRCGILLKSS